MPLLTLSWALPLAGALLLLLLPNKDGSRNGLIRWAALAISLVCFGVTLAIWAAFDATSGDYQMVERLRWIPAFGIDYYIGVDGISLLLIVLTGFLTPIALLSSWESVEKKIKEFSVFVLVLEAAMIGVFVSIDLFLFYVFWDAMLIPMYFLIGIWGYDQRIYAAVKFMLYTMAGSVLMLIAILTLAWMHSEATGAYTFDLVKLYALEIAPETQRWLFLAFALAFAIKVPLFPFHTWLPDAHVQAPTAGSVILAGVLLKMGTYGLLRFAFPLFPVAAVEFAPWIAGLAVMRADMFFGTQGGVIMQADRSGYDDGLPYTATLVGGWETFQSGAAQVTWHQARAIFASRFAEPFQPQLTATVDHVITIPPPPPPGLDPGVLDVWDEGLWGPAGSGNILPVPPADMAAYAQWDQPAAGKPPIRNTMWVSIGMSGFAHAPIVQVQVAQAARPDVELIAIGTTQERGGINV